MISSDQIIIIFYYFVKSTTSKPTIYYLVNGKQIQCLESVKPGTLLFVKQTAFDFSRAQKNLMRFICQIYSHIIYRYVLICDEIISLEHHKVVAHDQLFSTSRGSTTVMESCPFKVSFDRSIQSIQSIESKSSHALIDSLISIIHVVSSSIDCNR